MVLEIREGSNNIVTQATVVGFAFGEKANNIHRINVLWD